jgi:aminoglycoside phosphotransferase (APT) family kinase protein
MTRAAMSLVTKALVMGWTLYAGRLAADKPMPMGNHNINRRAVAKGRLIRKILRLDHAKAVKIRAPIDGALKFDQRDWTSEETLLKALGCLPHMQGHIAQLLFDTSSRSVYEFAEGSVLEDKRPSGERLYRRQLDGIERLFGLIVSVRRADLPAPSRPLPSSATEFLRNQANFTLHEVYESDRFRRYRALFEELGVLQDRVREYVQGLPELHDRPLAFVHGDLHRRNVVVGPGGSGVVLLDWELARFADPLYELATHLWLMNYPASQRPEVIKRWKRAVSGVNREFTRGADADLPVYEGYKRVQSLITDVIRGAERLEKGEGSLDRDAHTVVRLMREAPMELALSRLPSHDEVVRIYREWADPTTSRWWKTGKSRVHWLTKMKGVPGESAVPALA